MTPKMRYFQRGTDVLGVDVNEPDCERTAQVFIQRGWHEVDVRPKRPAGARVAAVLVLGVVAAFAVGLAALGLKLLWTAVLS